MSAKENLVDKIVSRETPYVIAEIGINHNGDMQLAREMIDAAAENGASCVKFQNFIVNISLLWQEKRTTKSKISFWTRHKMK